MALDVASLYAARALPREPLSELIISTIAKLKISFKPPFRRPAFRNNKRETDDISNWREHAMVDMVRKVREKDDADYSDAIGFINKMTKQNFAKMIASLLEKLDKRKEDNLFRLRVTTLLFDNGVRQTFFAPMMADAYAEISKVYPDALQDLLTQASMFETLYDASKVVNVPLSTEPGYDEAILAWTKQKDTKRGFAIYVAELYSRGLIPADLMNGFVKTVMSDLKESIRHPKIGSNEEHVDALVRFVFAVTSKVDPAFKNDIRAVLATPKIETPSLNMKSRFKLDDALKL